MAQKQLHHLKFPPAQADGLPGAGEQARSRVKRDVPEGQYGRGVGPAAAQHRAHTRNELVRLEGLGQIVVRPGVEASDAVILLAARREHHHGRLNALLTQAAQHLQPVQPRHHHIEDHGVVVPAAGVVIGRETVVHDVHGELILFKQNAQGLGEVKLVLGNQQTHGFSLLSRQFILY